MEDETPGVVAEQRKRKALLKLEQPNEDVVLTGIVVDTDDAHATARGVIISFASLLDFGGRGGKYLVIE